MTESLTKHFNIRRDRVPRFNSVMPRIRAHYPYTGDSTGKEAGLSWIVMDALETFADILDALDNSGLEWTPKDAIRAFGDFLDANAAAEKPRKVPGQVGADETHTFVDWTCPECRTENRTGADDGTPVCPLCGMEVDLDVWPGRTK